MLSLLSCEVFNNKNNNNNPLTFIMRLGKAMQTQRRRSLHIGKTHDQQYSVANNGYGQFGDIVKK